MPKLSKQDINDRLDTFAKLVRDGGYFKPEQTWWLMSTNKKSTKKYPTAVNLLEQLDISLEDMTTHYTDSWTGQIGALVFRDILRQGVIVQSIFITVLSKDINNNYGNSSPMDQSAAKVLKDGGMETRSTSWTSLRDAIIRVNNGCLEPDTAQTL